MCDCDKKVNMEIVLPICKGCDYYESTLLVTETKDIYFDMCIQSGRRLIASLDGCPIGRWKK